jgi:hypothetical protein
MRLGFLGGLAMALSMSALAVKAQPARVTRAQLEANKQLVLDFWRVVIEVRDLSHIGEYITPDMA